MGATCAHTHTHSYEQLAHSLPHTHTHTDAPMHRLSEEAKKFVAEWDLSLSSDEFDLNIEGEDQTLQHVPIEDWGCTLSDENN